MWYCFFNFFVKITAWPVQYLCFRTKVLYEDRAVQSRKIVGSAIIASNHTSVIDYAVFLFVFFGRTLRYQMAEVLFRKKRLGLFLRLMGGIFVCRNTADFSYIAKSADILQNGGVVGIFPEGRLPRKGEVPPLPFKSGAAFLSLQTQTPIIPVYTNGSYFSRKRSIVVIGKPLYPDEIEKRDLSDKEKIECLTAELQNKITELKNLYEKNESAECSSLSAV